jgi:hypothetical protein
LPGAVSAKKPAVALTDLSSSQGTAAAALCKGVSPCVQTHQQKHSLRYGRPTRSHASYKLRALHDAAAVHVTPAACWDAAQWLHVYIHADSAIPQSVEGPHHALFYHRNDTGKGTDKDACMHTTTSTRKGRRCVNRSCVAQPDEAGCDNQQHACLQANMQAGRLVHMQAGGHKHKQNNRPEVAECPCWTHVLRESLGRACGRKESATTRVWPPHSGCVDSPCCTRWSQPCQHHVAVLKLLCPPQLSRLFQNNTGSLVNSIPSQKQCSQVKSSYN